MFVAILNLNFKNFSKPTFLTSNIFGNLLSRSKKNHHHNRCCEEHSGPGVGNLADEWGHRLAAPNNLGPRI